MPCACKCISEWSRLWKFSRLEIFITATVVYSVHTFKWIKNALAGHSPYLHSHRYGYSAFSLFCIFAPSLACETERKSKNKNRRRPTSDDDDEDEEQKYNINITLSWRQTRFCALFVSFSFLNFSVFISLSSTLWRGTINLYMMNMRWRLFIFRSFRFTRGHNFLDAWLLSFLLLLLFSLL